MLKQRPIVVFGILGTLLDRAKAGEDRWLRWRPSVSVCQHEDLLITRFELFHEPKELPAHVVATLDLHRGAWLAVYSSRGQYLGRATLAARAAPGPAFGLAAGSDAVGLRFGDTAVLDMAAFAPGAAEAYHRIAGLPLAAVQPRAMLEGVLAVPAGVDHGVSGAGVVVDGAIAGVMAFKAIDAAMKLVTIRAGDAVAQPRANVPAPLRSIRLPRQATAYAQPVIDNAVLAGLGTAGQRVGAVRSTLAVEVFVPGFVHDACVGFRGQMQPG